MGQNAFLRIAYRIAAEVSKSGAPLPVRPGSFKGDSVWSWKYEPFFIKFDKPTPDGRKGIMGKRKYKVFDWVWDGTKWVDNEDWEAQFGAQDGEVQVSDGEKWMNEREFNAKYGDKVRKERPKWKSEPTPKAEFRKTTEDALAEFEAKGGKVDRNVSDPTVKPAYERVPSGPAPRHRDPFASVAARVAGVSTPTG